MEPPPRVSTTGTTTMATTVTHLGEVRGAITTARAMPSKVPAQAMLFQARREPNTLPSRAQASHPSVPHAKQSTPVVQPAPAEQSTLVVQPAPAEQPTPVVHHVPAEQPTLVAQPALVARPTHVVFQAAQVGPRLSQPSGPTIEPGAFSPYFSAHLTLPNSNLAPEVYHFSTAQGGTFLPSSSNPNGEQHLSRQVIELTSALAQRTTLVNQLLQRTKMQRVLNEVSRRRTRAYE